MPDTIDVVTAADRRFLWGCAVTIRSLLDSHAGRRPIRLVVIHDSFRSADEQRLRRSWVRSDGAPLDVRFHRIAPAEVAGLIRSKALSRMTYARLLIGDVLPATSTRAVYVDSDLLVERDIAELHDMPLHGSVLAAVPNGTPEDDARELQRIGANSGRYLNAGVFVADLELWRELQVGRNALELCRAHGDGFRIPDQDSLNLVVADRWTVLPESWNHWAARTPTFENRVIHFTMVPKPWDADYSGRFANRFYEYLDRTAFRGRRPVRLFGVGSALRRLRRRIPYLPTAFRLFRRFVFGR